MRGILIYNPMAGPFPSFPLVQKVANILAAEGWEIEITKTQGGDHITELAGRAAASGMDVVFMAGGDGSLHSAASGLMGTMTALAVLPAGTGNVWAQELDLPALSLTNWTALEDSVKKLLHGSIKSMDLGVCQGIPFLLWAGVGFDAFVVHNLEPRTKLQKHFAFPHSLANAAWLARTWPGMDLQIWTDGELVTDTYLVAVVTNVHLYAGGLAEISPSARIDDGIFDLWLFSGDSLMETFQHMYDLASGKHFSSKKIKSIQCKEILIKSETDLFIQMDGEPISPSKNVNISIQPHALRVLVPDKLSRPLFSADEE